MVDACCRDLHDVAVGMEKMLIQARLNGPGDQGACVVEVHAGAGTSWTSCCVIAFCFFVALSSGVVCSLLGCHAWH